MDEQDSLSAQQSIAIIQSMIDKTRHNLVSNRFYFLLWGWIAFIAISGQFVLKVWVHYDRHYLVWLLSFAGVIGSIWYGSRQGRRKKVTTYVEESMGNLWMGMGITFFLLFFLFVEIGFENCYPFYIMMYGLGTFVSGRILRFKPLMIGGVINWILAVVAIRFEFDYQMIFAAAAILFSYLIPGYLLKEK